jgi:hypothetical protein
VCSQIYASKSDAEAILAKLKITPCPHCKKTGFLIKHGSLIGFVANTINASLPVTNQWVDANSLRLGVLVFGRL